MKNKFALFLALAGMSMVLASCSKNGQVPNVYNDADLLIQTEWVDYAPPATSVKFDDAEKHITIKKGETYTYHPDLTPSKATLASVDWISGDESVFTVNKGVITAVGGGSATLTVASFDEGFNEVNLIVNVVVPLERIEINLLEPIAKAQTGIESLDLDFNEQARVGVSYFPEDTTETGVTFSIDREEVATVDENGLVTGAQLANYGEDFAELTATSPYGPSKTIQVHVWDHTVHVESLKVFEEESEVEVDNISLAVGESKDLRTEVYAADPTQTPTVQTVSYVSSNPAVAIVSADGLVTAVIPDTPLASTVSAVITVNAENNIKKDIPVTVSEVVPATVHVAESVVNIDTVNVTSAQIEVIYKDGGGNVVIPSLPSPAFASDDSSVVTVSPSGLLTAVSQGTATITVTDTRYSELSFASVTVNVKKGTESVIIDQPSVKIWPGESTEISASVLPLDSDFQDVEFEITNGATLISISNLGSNRCRITSLGTEGKAEVTAKCGNKSAKCAVNITKEGDPFPSDVVYVVGENRTNGTGYGEHAHPGWEDSRFADPLSTVYDDKYAAYSCGGVVYFDVDDLWKLRQGSTWFELSASVTDDEGTHATGRYKTNEGAFLDGAMSSYTDEEGYVMVKVHREGFYEIYYKYYDDTTYGYYEVFVKEHALGVNKSNTNIVLNNTSTIIASGWNGLLTVTSTEPSKVEVTNVDLLTGKVTLTGKALTDDTLIEFSDDRNVLYVHAKVVSSIASDGYYLVGSFNAWTTEDLDYVLIKDGSDANHYYIEELEVTAGQAFKVYNANNNTYLSNESEWVGCDFTLDDDGNVVFSRSGIYTVNFYVSSGDGNHITIARTGGEDPVSDTHYMMHGIGANWSNTNMKDKNSGSEYYLTNFHLSAGEEFVFYMDGDYRKWNDVKLSAFASSHFEDNGGNIKVKAGMGGYYDIYVSSSPEGEEGEYPGKYIWLALGEGGLDPSTVSTYYFEYGSNKVALNSDTLSAADVEAGVTGKYTLTANVEANTHFSWFADVDEITEHIGPSGDDILGELYNNYIHSASSGYTIQHTTANAYIELKTYGDGGYSFWISGGDSSTHVPEEDQFTVYFTNNIYWSTVKAYVFNSVTHEQEHEWESSPLATKVAVDKFGADVYSYTYDASLYDSIIFHDGSSNQTEDILVDTSHEYIGYYCSQIVEGAYTVGTYTYGLEVENDEVALTIGDEVDVSYFKALDTVSVKSNTTPSVATASIVNDKLHLVGATAGSTVVTITDGVSDVVINVTVSAVSSNVTYTFNWSEYGVYGGGGCNVVAWVWVYGQEGHAVDCTYINDNSCSITVETSINRVILVQVKTGITAANFDWEEKKADIYNQAAEITVSSTGVKTHTADWPW